MAKINVIPNVKDYIDYEKKVLFGKLRCEETLTNYQSFLLSKFLNNGTKNE